MMLRVVGAGLARTGTNSLKVALERLLGGHCYHMYELIERPGDTEHWERAAAGTTADWRWLQREYVATVDFPAAMFWRELLAASPEAVVLLSARDSAQVWWESFARTIVPSLAGEVPADRPDWARRRAMNLSVLARLTPDWRERAAVIAAYERHNDEVRRTVPTKRLIDWRPGDGGSRSARYSGWPSPPSPFRTKIPPPTSKRGSESPTRHRITDLSSRRATIAASHPEPYRHEQRATIARGSRIVASRS